MVLHSPTPDTRATELGSLDRAVRREMRWVYARAIVVSLVSLAIGLACIAWAVHSTDEQSGLIAFWGGLLISNGGILGSLFVTYNRAMREGWL